MQRTFEENIEKQLKSFQLQPSSIVWQEVEAALHAKKRRILPFWWITFAGILLLGGFLLFNHFNTSKSVEHRSVQNVSIKSNSSKESASTTSKQQVFIIEKKSVVNENKSNINSAKKHELIEEKHIDENKIKSIKNRKYIQTLESNTNSIIVETNSFKPKAQAYNSTHIIPINEQRPYFVKANVLPIQSLLPSKFGIKQINTDSTIQSSAFQNTAQKDGSNKNIPPARKWFITGSMGLLTTKQNNFLGKIATQDALANFGNSGSIVSVVNPNTIKYSNGTVLMLGSGFQQQLSKKWSYNLALNYKLLSTKVSTIDSLFRFQCNNYKAHWIEIPINITYQLSNSAYPFYLTVGLSGAYAFTSNWSYADLRTNGFYNDKTKNRKLFVNAQIAAACAIQKNWLMQVAVEKSLTSIHKKVADKFYYTQFNVQLFRFIQSKSKNKIKK
jgi:hypothetical protein